MRRLKLRSTTLRHVDSEELIGGIKTIRQGSTMPNGQWRVNAFGDICYRCFCATILIFVQERVYVKPAWAMVSRLASCGKIRLSFRDGRSGPSPEPKNTGQADFFPIELPSPPGCRVWNYRGAARSRSAGSSSGLRAPVRFVAPSVREDAIGQEPRDRSARAPANFSTL